MIQPKENTESNVQLQIVERKKTVAPFSKSAERATVTVLIPTLNEEENLPHVLPQLPEWIDEVILIDGRSTDRTVEVAKELRPDIKVVMETKKGKGAALRAGFMAASGDIVVMMDADGSTDPSEIAAFVGALLAGADFAKGSRFMQGAGTDDMPFYKMIGNSALTILTNILYGSRYTDITYGYNAIWRKNGHALALEIDGWAHEIISNIRVKRHALRVVEVACFEQDRIAGEAKLSAFPAGWAILKAIVRERFTPLKRAPQAETLRPNFKTQTSPVPVHTDGK